MVARETSMSFRNDELIEMLDTSLRDPLGRARFAEILFEYRGDAPLSWYLTDAHKQDLYAGMSDPENTKELQRLKELFR